MQENDHEFPLSKEKEETIEKLVKKSRRDVPLFYDEGECEIIYIPIEDGEIRVFHHKPERITTKRPILFFPGFATTPWSWREFHLPHHGTTEYYHLETREKASSKIRKHRKVNFTMKQTAKDIAVAIDYLKLNQRDYVMVGTSYTGGAVLSGLIEGFFDPPTTMVFDPLCVWAYAKFWVNWLLPIMPSFILGALRFVFAKIIMTGMKNEAQKERNMDFIRGADPFKWRKACLDNRKLNLVPDLHKIKNEVIVVHGTKDKFHPGETFYKYAKLIPKGRFLYMDTSEADRELLNGIVGTALANITKEQQMPEILAQFEVDLGRE